MRFDILNTCDPLQLHLCCVPISSSHSFRCKSKCLLPGHYLLQVCARERHNWEHLARKKSRCLHSCLNPKVYSSLLMSPPPAPFYYLLFTTPSFNLPPAQTGRAYPLAHPAATSCSHTKKTWPASCRLGEAVFTVTPFWRRGLIPLLSGAAYVCVNVCVCVCVCLHSHVLLHMFVCLPAQHLNYFGGSH